MNHQFSPPSDLSALVRRAQAGDRDAMEALYLESYGTLWRTVRGMTKNDADALDVLQESYLQAFTHLDRLRKPSRFLPWLKRIAVNELRQQLRRTQPLLFTELSPEGDAVPEPPDTRDTPELALERTEQADALQQVIDTLPDGQRAILILYYCEQYSIREIAVRLGVTQGTVKAQLHHGRKKLEAALRNAHETEKAAPSGAGLGALALGPLLSKWQAAQPLPAKKTAPATLLGQLPEHAATLTVKSAASVLLTRLAIGATVLTAVGGLAFGANRLLHGMQAYGDVQPPVPTETLRLDAVPVSGGDLLLPTEAPTEPLPPDTVPTEFPTEPPEPPTTPPTTPPTESPVTPTTPPEPAAPTATPDDAAATDPATSGDLPAADPDAASSGDLPDEGHPMLPTEPTYPFRYQELTLAVGSSWTSSFVTELEWYAQEGSGSSSCIIVGSHENGSQTFTLRFSSPGTYQIYLCSRSEALSWVPWLTVTVLADD